MTDTRKAVRHCMPGNCRWTFRQHAIRLPVGTAVVFCLSGLTDRLLIRSGDLLEWIGMLPFSVIRLLGCGMRVARFTAKALHAPLCCIGRLVRCLPIRVLRAWDVVRDLLHTAVRRTVYVLELLRCLRVFTFLDRLDQRCPSFRRAVHALMRGLVEVRWLIEGIDVCIDLKRPVLCLVQPTPVRPVAQVLEALPSSMTSEVQQVLRLTLQAYRTLGEQGYIDGESSIDNVGFEATDAGVRVVLLDAGALVSAEAVSPRAATKWLHGIRQHYIASYQLWKLRRNSTGNAEMQRVVGAFADVAVHLMDHWIDRMESENARHAVRDAAHAALPDWDSERVGLAKAG